MPFLRVVRDKRGYETTYLMHWFRDGQRQRSKILYVSRAPGGVRVGRQVLDAEAVREIEAAHPDIEFDWQAVREQKQVIDTAPEPRRRRKAEAEAPKPKPAAVPAAQPSTARPAVPSTIEGETPAEQMAFLALWHPQLRDRIAQRVSDPSRREALLALAERLNAGAWTDADQITSGLESAAEALERLAHVFARRRRRARKRGAGGAAASAGSAESREVADTALDSPSDADSGPDGEEPHLVD